MSIESRANIIETAHGFVGGAGAYSTQIDVQTVSADGGEACGLSNWWAKMFAGQDKFLEHVLGGFTDMESGFGEMFASFLDSGNTTFDQLAGNLSKMGSSLFGGLTKQSGQLSGLAGSVGSAMSFLAPVGSILTAGFGLFKGIKSLFGGKKKRLASPVMNFSDYNPSSNTTVNNSNRSVNVYINGQSLNSAVEVDRTLGRAGVDRSLRDQIKELVRSGANPVA